LEEIKDTYWINGNFTGAVTGAVHQVLIGMPPWEIRAIQKHLAVVKKRTTVADNTELLNQDFIKELLAELDRVDSVFRARVERAIRRSPSGTGVYVKKGWLKECYAIICVKLKYPKSEEYQKQKIRTIQRTG
jgi:hypothetical protein